VVLKDAAPRLVDALELEHLELSGRAENLAEQFDRLLWLGALTPWLAGLSKTKILNAIEESQTDLELYPERFSALGQHAERLQDALELPDDHPVAGLLAAASDVEFAEIPVPALAHTLAVARSARRQQITAEWLSWVSEQAEHLQNLLGPVLEAVPVFAADDGAGGGLTRALVGTVFGGEVTLARVADGLLVEWLGAGPPPASVMVGEQPLALAPDAASPAIRAWLLTFPPSGPLVLRLADSEGNEHRIEVR